MRWVEEEFGIKKELLQADVKYRDRKHIEVILSERLLAKEGLEFPDECLVWVGLDRRRFKQFRGQRVIDLTYEMCLYVGEPQAGPLIRTLLPAQMESGLRPDERLVRAPIELNDRYRLESTGVEIFTSTGHWIVTPDFATQWLASLTMRIIARKNWIICNGGIWQVESLAERGDVYRVIGETPFGLPIQVLSNKDYGPGRYQGQVTWKD
jgi:hypothetical protein